VADPNEDDRPPQHRDGPPAPRIHDDGPPRTGGHPEMERSGRSNSTALVFAAFLVGAVVMYAAIAAGIIGSG
jgi:hypothetical protein